MSAKYGPPQDMRNVPPEINAKLTGMSAANAMREVIDMPPDCILSDEAFFSAFSGMASSCRVSATQTVAITINKPTTPSDQRQPIIATPQANGNPAATAPT